MIGPSGNPSRPLEPATKPDNWSRGRCENCSKPFEKTKPNRRFCCEKCQKEYHRHGAAYGPLKDKLEKLIEKRVAEQLTERVTKVITALIYDERFKAQLAAAGFIHRSQLGKPLARLRHLWNHHQENPCQKS
jgi:predicted amidophosphoribosyltransferase